MPHPNANIIQQLQKEILPLQGFRTSLNANRIDIGLGIINNAFPNKQFPLGAIHEFLSTTINEVASSSGFIAAMLGPLMQNGGAITWIGTARKIFPPALASFGIAPDKIIFIDLQKEKDIPWVMEEALKCDGLAAVVGEMKELDFTSSRRLQLAVEQSKVTGFIIRKNPRQLNTTACVSRWKITSLPSNLEPGMPGVGFPRWNVNLLKIRNGKPGEWQLEWRNGLFKHFSPITPISIPQQKKTG